MDHEALADFKIALVRELLAKLEAERSDTVVMLEMGGDEPEFFTLRFALAGEALRRLDEPWHRVGGGAYVNYGWSA